MLVSRVPGIRDRYLQFRRQKKGSRRQALFYLLWLNVQYYLNWLAIHKPGISVLREEANPETGHKDVANLRRMIDLAEANAPVKL